MVKLGHNYFAEGDFVTLIPLFKTKRETRFVIRLEKGQVFHSKFGVINHDEIIGRVHGSIVKSHLNYNFVVLPATLHEVIQNYKHFKYITQIIYPRDWGFISVFADIKEGDKIIEIGTGTGAFLSYLSRLVGSSGFIYSYEKDEERAKIANRNLRELGLTGRCLIKVRDVVKEGIDERNVDVVFIDIPEPWLVVKRAWCALKPGGRMIVYIPTFNQLKKTVIELMRHGFIDIKIKEGFLRNIQVKPYAIRPELKGYYFSAFIIFARKSFVIPVTYLEDLFKLEYLGEKN